MFEDALKNTLGRGNKQEITTWGKPNFVARYAIGSGFVAPVNGFVYCDLWTNGAERTVHVNGVMATHIGSGGNAMAIAVTVPVKKGDVITINSVATYFTPDFS